MTSIMLLLSLYSDQQNDPYNPIIFPIYNYGHTIYRTKCKTLIWQNFEVW